MRVVFVYIYSFAILFISAPLVGCASLPISPQSTLGATTRVKDQIAKQCEIEFTSSSIDNEVILQTGKDLPGIYSIVLFGMDDKLMQATFTVAPEAEPVMWRDNHIDRCLVRFLDAIEQPQLYLWYYENRDSGGAVEETDDIQAKLTGDAEGSLVFEITARDFAEQVAATDSTTAFGNSPGTQPARTLPLWTWPALAAIIAGFGGLIALMLLRQGTTPAPAGARPAMPGPGQPAPQAVPGLQPAATPPRAVLLLERGRASRSKLPLATDHPYVLGRHPTCDLMLDDPQASGRHAEIRYGTHGFGLVDLGSTNGTLLNGKPVGQAHLRDGDQIEIGATLLRFRVLE